MPQDFDIIILGAGTTAFAGGRLAASHGKKVLMIEQSKLGGACVNWGCVPSKTLIHKAEMYQAARKGKYWGLNLQAGVPDCSNLMELKQAAVETLRTSHYQQELDHSENFELLHGRGHFLSATTLEVCNQQVRAPQILIATGGSPRIIPLAGLEKIKYLTSLNSMNLAEFPKSLIMLGGGVIALEMGQMFSRFGTSVTILERNNKLLSEFDPRLTEQFRAMLELEGIKVLFNVESHRVEQRNGEVCLYASTAGNSVEICAERLMLAIGTQPNSAELGLEQVGIKLDADGFIHVDEQLRTSVPGIWAAGDVTGQPLIAPAGVREAYIAIKNMLEPQAGHSIDHRISPMAVFVDPEFASVGLTRQQAEALGVTVVTTYLGLDQVAKAHVMGDFLGGVLLNAEMGSGKVLGVQMLCPRAADIIQEATLAVRFGLSVADLATTVHVYPSISDALRLAAQENALEQGLL